MDIQCPGFRVMPGMTDIFQSPQLKRGKSDKYLMTKIFQTLYEIKNTYEVDKKDKQ